MLVEIPAQFRAARDDLRALMRELDRLMSRKLEKERKEEQTRRDGLLSTAAIIAVLIATVAYTALLSVPGAWSPTACSGAPTSAQDTCAVAMHQAGFRLFMYANACALGFALGTVSIVVMLTLTPTPEGAVQAQSDRLIGRAALLFVVAGVASLVVSSVGAYKIILPHSWPGPAITLVTLVGLSVSVLYIVGLSQTVWLAVRVDIITWLEDHGYKKLALRLNLY